MAYILLALLLFPMWAFPAANTECAACHAEIYRRYAGSAMARSSGLVTASSAVEKLPAVVSHQGKRLLVRNEKGRAVVSFDEGMRSLDYFIGSGAVGRSYVSLIGAHLFQAPVSWYTGPARWNMSPGFEKSPGVNLLRPVEPACLRCHASGVQHIEGTTNEYATPAFVEGGVSCERCHGSGEAHIALARSGKGGGIVNPSKLEPERRDGVCAQCHLSGATEISRGPGAKAFRPGERLSERSVTFVWSSSSRTMPVISHFERMARSRCRQAAPDRFWCGTCHNPHTSVTQDATYYRAKCLTCHGGTDCSGPGADRVMIADACTVCHMPRTSAATVQHAAFTDHSIPRRPTVAIDGPIPSDAVLLPFGNTKATDREFALAWADVALRENNPTWGRHAFKLLQAEYERSPADTKIATQLAQLYDRMGQETRACEIYRRIIELESNAIAPAINLGACLAKQGRIDESIRLWTGVLQRSPGQEGARLNLAVAQVHTGNLKAARATLTKALELNPLSARARELLARLDQNQR